MEVPIYISCSDAGLRLPDWLSQEQHDPTSIHIVHDGTAHISLRMFTEREKQARQPLHFPPLINAATSTVLPIMLGRLS